jgi:hypothetical protein
VADGQRVAGGRGDGPALPLSRPSRLPDLQGSPSGPLPRLSLPHRRGGIGSAAVSRYEQVYDVAGTYTWTCPADVIRVTVECWGGGGGGGGTRVFAKASGGGGGGGYSRSSLVVAPTVSYDVVVGAAGTVATGVAGGLGGDSNFDGRTLTALGGSGGSLGASKVGGVGGVGARIGTGEVVYAGGDGAAGNGSGYLNCGGGGGGSAGSAVAGSAATGQSGAAAVNNGGPGGAGGALNLPGNPPAATPGGGGGGAGTRNTGSGLVGGAGAAGKVRITATSVNEVVMVGGF